MTFELRDFQKDAVGELREAAIEWTHAVAGLGPPRSGRQRVPLLASLTAITGAGKTPILASVIGGLGPSIVFWTTKSSFLVDQTVAKLDTAYRPFLPDGTQIVGEMPSRAQWRSLLDDETGTTIWVRTVASWNDTDAGAKNTEDARLNLHRPAPDWTDDERRSPWTILGDRSARKRPLWVVYDEGHGQTSVQLDQLIELDPEGLFAATATPLMSAKFKRLRDAVAEDDVFGPIADRARVVVPTSDVATAGLLKTTVEVEDLDVEASGRIAVVATALDDLDRQARRQGGRLRPRAIYIVEKSDLRRGEKGEPRPVVIWRTLVEQCGVPPAEIAVATDTKELPKDAVRIRDFAALRPRHRHIIFNKKLQEGWDDPEAYIAYFDGETSSALRITQLIGRVIRQPDGKHAATKALNTAHLFVSAPNKKFEAIVESLRKSLLTKYGADADGTPAIELKTRLTPGLPPVVLRAGVPELSLPVYDQAAGGMEAPFRVLTEAGERVFPSDQLSSPGIGTIRALDLTKEDADVAERARQIGENIRTTNRTFFLERVESISRAAKLRLDAKRVLVGPMWDQEASARASAQGELGRLARDYVTEYEARVRYVPMIDPDVEPWRPRPYEPRLPKGKQLVEFERSLHTHYPNTPSVLSPDELEFARALDAVEGGRWARNFDRAALNGYGIPLPVAVGGSNTFFPDFLWWIDGGCWAIDTTGGHLAEAKIRGKLFALADPRFALVVRGRLTTDVKGYESRDGWSLVLPKIGAEPKPIHSPDLPALLGQIRAAIGALAPA